MKKIKTLFLAALFAAMLHPAQSHATEAQNTSPAPAGYAGINETLNYQGSKPKVVTGTTTVMNLVHNGPIFLDAICPFGGSQSGNWVVAIDALANSTTSIAQTTTTWTVAAATNAATVNWMTLSTATLSSTYYASNQSSATLASPLVYTVANSTVSFYAAGGNGLKGQVDCWKPPYPIKIVNALWSLANDTSEGVMYYLHCSDGSNPCYP